MICPFCNSDQTFVSNSRSTGQNTQIWRRRKCLKCLSVFTTHEKIDLSSIIVIKSDNRHQKFSKNKLYSSIYNAVIGEKKIDRGTASEITNKIMEKVELKIILLKTKTITTKQIKKIVLEILKKDYPSSYLRYLAYFQVHDK